MKHKLPPVPRPDLVLYHWSPTEARNSIKKRGLDINRLSRDGIWRPPFVCFADDPMMAWQLSGKMWLGIPSWDLWSCHVPSATSFDSWEIITDTYPTTGRTFIKEYRVYSRVYKRDLDYVATRTEE